MSPPARMRPITTSGHGKPCAMRIAVSALTRATVEPTERSMPPVVMTKVIAIATMKAGAA
jgi:hypothetical protein